MAKKTEETGETKLEKSLAPLDQSPAMVALREAEKIQAEEKANADIFFCVCGNNYDAVHFRKCPRCERPAKPENRSAEEQDGGQNF